MNNRQIEELAKYCMIISQASLASWVLGVATPKFTLFQAVLMVGGLIFAVLFLILGLRLFKEVK